MAEDKTHAAIEAENGKERGVPQSQNQGYQGEKIDVHRRKIYSVTIYDVTESELSILEKGTDASVWLNFLIGSFSVAVSFLISLLTAKWGEGFSITQLVFICVTIIMFVVAAICVVFWIRGRGEHKTTIKTIKERTIQENCKSV